VEPFEPQAAILEALATLHPGRWTGTVWRHTFADNPPDQRNVRGARWNPPGVEALYTSLTEGTALAEAEHLIAVQPLRTRARRTMYQLEVELGAVVDLSDESVLASLGVSRPNLEGDDYSACQAVGGAAAFLQLDGIIVPSARTPGENLVILFSNVESHPVLRVLGSESVD
jgi:RES domain-containing protein